MKAAFESIEKLMQYIKNEQFDTDSFKLDTKDPFNSNLRLIINDDQMIETITNFIAMDASMKLYHYIIINLSSFNNIQ